MQCFARSWAWDPTGPNVELLDVRGPALLVTSAHAECSLPALSLWPRLHQWERGWTFRGLAPRVARSLGNALDHGELPSPCSSQPLFKHLITSELLPCGSTDFAPIVFPTCMPHEPSGDVGSSPARNLPSASMLLNGLFPTLRCWNCFSSNSRTALSFL